MGRSASPLRFTELDPVDAASPRAGNRFDVLGGQVLYAASDPQGAFAETLGRFRPTVKMRNLPVEPDEHYMAIGSIAADWRERRQLSEISLVTPLPFLDVDAPATHAFLTAEIAGPLEAFDIDALDISDVRGRNRLLTRAISQWAYAAVDKDGDLRYGGIRYTSKLGNWECWAIFGGSEVREVAARAIEKTNTDLLEVATSFGLTIH